MSRRRGSAPRWIIRREGRQGLSSPTQLQGQIWCFWLMTSADEGVVNQIDPDISASRGRTVAGGVLWLAMIAFVFAILSGLAG